MRIVRGTWRRRRLDPAVAGEPVLLESGCVCCTFRGDLAHALAGLRRSAAPEHLGQWIGPRRSVIVFVTEGLTEPAVADSLATFLRLAKPAVGRAVSPA